MQYLIRTEPELPMLDRFWSSSGTRVIDTFRLRQNGWHFSKNILNSIFLNKNQSLIRILLEFVPKSPIDNKSTLYRFEQWLVACSMLNHYLNQCWPIVILTLKNTFLSNLNQNSTIFVKENAFQNGICKLTAILLKPQCVKSTLLH